MIQLSDRINSMEESATIAMSRKSRELKASGKDIISLSLGEPDFFTPQFIKDAALEAMNKNFTMYTPVAGYDDLRESIAFKFKRDNGLEYSKDQIVVSTGAKQSIANVVLSIINPGDEVIIPAPYWVSYLEIVKIAEGNSVVIPATIDSDFKITAAQLKKAITPKTRMMIFSTPCNPTGSVYSKQELFELAQVLKEHPQLVVISDEIYEHINFSGHHESLAQFPEVYNQVVTVNGLSKAWAMTGWRLGYIGASKEIASACDKMQGQFTSATCSITQRAAIAAMHADPGATEENTLFQPLRSPTIEATLALQLAQRSALAQKVAGLAAMVGRRFALPLLTKLWPNQVELIDALEELLQAGLISEQADGCFAFTHQALHQLTQARLTPLRQQLYRQLILEHKQDYPIK